MMQPFRQLQAVAAPLRRANVDTDMILAARFLKTTRRDGLGAALFSALREDPDFMLNRPPWNAAGILIALDNFGCGSSREHAPWALLDFGIRCVIAPSFADIFYGNCFKNGILPVALPREEVERLLVLAEASTTAGITVDLTTRTLTSHDGRAVRFEIDPDRRRGLLEGVDEITRTLGDLDEILTWEARRSRAEPWVMPIDEACLAGSAAT